jgi:hypothetical protein
MAWNEEQIEFLKEYLDDFQFSLFLLKKEEEIDSIDYFFNTGNLNWENFKDLEDKIDLLKIDSKEYINNPKNFNNIDKILNYKNKLILDIEKNIDNENILKIEEKYKNDILDNQSFFIRVDKNILIKYKNKYIEKLKEKIVFHHKILLFNYYAITLIMLYVIYLQYFI